MIKRLVIRSPNWLGDAVMALPAVASVRAHFSGATLAVAAPEPLAPLFEMADGVDEVVRLRGRASDATRLADGRFDVAVLLPNSFQAVWTAYRARIPERWGYRSDLRGALLTRAVARVKNRGRAVRHQSQYYLDLVQALGMASAPLEASLVVSEATRRRADELLADSARASPISSMPHVGVAPGAAYGHAKRWPPHHFAELIRRIDEELGARAVLVGTAQDRDAGREIESSLGRVACLNLIGRTDLGTLIGVMSACRAFVSNDSGAMHLAAAAGVPVTAIFGPTDERVTSPLGSHQVVVHPVWCRPCLLRECPIDHRCMTRITPDMVFERVRSAFSSRLS